MTMMSTKGNYIYNIFEAIATYAVDTQGGDGNLDPALFCEIGLDENVFYQQIYVHRPIADEIYESLQGFQPVLLYGFPGTGKTTITRKLLHDIESSEKRTQIIKFDFKGLDNIADYGENFDIRRWHRERLRSKLDNILNRLGISDYEILFFFFEERNSSYQMDYEFEQFRRLLYNEYRSSLVETSFYEWFKSNFETKKEMVVEIANKLIKEVRNRDYLFYLVQQDDLQPRRCIIFYDNLDSITFNEVRKDFYKYIREYSGVINRFAHIIITSRTSSIADQSMADYGAYDWRKIQVDYREFVDEKLYEKRIKELIASKGYCNPEDKLEIKRKLEYFAKENFAKKIIEKRTQFLENTFQREVIKAKVNENDLENIKEIYNLIIYSKYIHQPLLDLSNHDRHWMFRHLVNFIRYILIDLELRPMDLGETFDERSFILESFFYHWTIENEKLNCKSYDIVRDTEEWIESLEGLGCSFAHIMVAVIYNLTSRERGEHTYTSHTTVREVIEKLSDLGYSEEDVRSKIFELLKKDDNYLGLIETTRYFNVSQFSDMLDTDGIWLTPRTAYICEYLSLKFLYMIALYRSNKIKDYKNRTFDYQDMLPVSLDNIAANLDFLCRIAAVHYLALCSIKNKLSDREDWYNFYRRFFCIKVYEGNPKDRFGDLQLNNILRSHVKFLERQGTIDTYEYITPQIVSQYRKLSSAFKEAIDQLRKGTILRETTYPDLYQYFRKRVDWRKFTAKEE